jgi:hypothetical protein
MFLLKSMTKLEYLTVLFNSVLEKGGCTVSFLGIHKWEPDIYIGFSPALHLQCVVHISSHFHIVIMHRCWPVYWLLYNMENTMQCGRPVQKYRAKKYCADLLQGFAIRLYGSKGAKWYFVPSFLLNSYCQYIKNDAFHSPTISCVYSPYNETGKNHAGTSLIKINKVLFVIPSANVLQSLWLVSWTN